MLYKKKSLHVSIISSSTLCFSLSHCNNYSFCYCYCTASDTFLYRPRQNPSSLLFSHILSFFFNALSYQSHLLKVIISQLGMEETTQDSNKVTKWVPQGRTFRGGGGGRVHPPLHDHGHGQTTSSYQYHYQHHQQQQQPRYFRHHHNPFQNSNGVGFFGQNQHLQGNPPLLPLPFPPPVPMIPFQVSSAVFFHQSTQNQSLRSKTHFHGPSWKKNTHPVPSSSSDRKIAAALEVYEEGVQLKLMPANVESRGSDINPQALVVARRPDRGGVEGRVISLLANHYCVQFNPSQRIFHYDVEILPSPSKEVARLIKRKLVEDDSESLSDACPAYDGRRNLYSPIEFRDDNLEFFISLPIHTTKSPLEVCDLVGVNHQKVKLFRVNIKLVSKLDAKDLNNYLSTEGLDKWVPLPQDYLHALDVVLRESPTEKCIQVGRSLYSSSMGGGVELGGGAIGLRGFFQSLRPTQQGLALNVDLSATAFHESIGIISYLQKKVEFLHDLPRRKTSSLNSDERKEVEKVLKNVRVFVSHRHAVQRYRVQGLTQEATEDLWFKDRDGTKLRLVDYFKDQYNHVIQFRNLPCLQISMSKPCYLPMELCMICEGQKFLGKLSDDQTAKLLKMGCQRPRERRAIIDGVVNGPFGPMSSDQVKEFKLEISREMTRLKGRILQPPKLKLGEGGLKMDLAPSRLDCQWNLYGSHVVEGTRIERWALISFGGTPSQKSNIPRFIHQLASKCDQMGIFLDKSTTICTQFEPIQVLNNVSLLESKLKKIQKMADGKLQLLLCLMEKKHKGYGDLKRIAETRVGLVSQCCLHSNLGKLSSQFLVNLALKINAKVGGSTVALYNSLPSQIPRTLRHDEPIIFMGADVTHPHPLDDFSPSVAAVVGSVNWPSSNKYVSRIRSQTHRQEIIQDLGEMVVEILVDFMQEVTKLPKMIIFFRDGVSETQFYKVLKEELQSIRNACTKFPGYKPLITFAVVQKRHHTRLFPDENDPNCKLFANDNVPPGTIVDTVITHPREFDFYLCSHWGAKGTSRPAHYHVLWDESGFTSDEFQKLVYSLCFTFVRCTKPISIVPPAYYAHLAAYRGRLYLDRPESVARGTATAVSRAGPPKAAPLPKISENVKKLMFYC